MKLFINLKYSQNKNILRNRQKTIHFSREITGDRGNFNNKKHYHMSITTCENSKDTYKIDILTKKRKKHGVNEEKKKKKGLVRKQKKKKKK